MAGRLEEAESALVDVVTRAPQFSNGYLLLGDWRAETGERVVRESWREVSTDSWEGSGETRGPAGERVDSESLRLVAMGGGVFYLAKVAHNVLPVAFELVEQSPGHAVFANPDHDFPRRIEYVLRDGVLRVRVNDGGEKGFELTFTRPAD